MTPEVIERLRRFEALLTRYVQYAESIGCQRVHDSIDCTAHQAEELSKWWDRQTTRPPYHEALKTRPRGSCYCDHDDQTCYEAGHWNAGECLD